jgi:hypothetical protein
VASNWTRAQPPADSCGGEWYMCVLTAGMMWLAVWAAHANSQYMLPRRLYQCTQGWISCCNGPWSWCGVHGDNTLAKKLPACAKALPGHAVDMCDMPAGPLVKVVHSPTCSAQPAALACMHPRLHAAWLWKVLRWKHTTCLTLLGDG